MNNAAPRIYLNCVVSNSQAAAVFAMVRIQITDQEF